MSGKVIVVPTDAEFSQHLKNAGSKLVVVDFFASWCGPCRTIAPKYEEFAAKYTNAVFLKVDVDQCEETAQSQGVSAMPTFILYKVQQKLDKISGANPNGLKELIEKHYQADEDDDVQVKGFVDLTNFLNKAGCVCLNADSDHTLEHGLNKKGGFLQSDCDEQLLITLEFNQQVKIHSLKMNGPQDKGPKTIRIFINQPNTLDFDSALRNKCTQEIELTKDDLDDQSIIPLKFVKFQNVNNLTIFVKDNQEEDDITQIDYFSLIGAPVCTTNMGEFKRVSGKKGESH